MSFLLSFTTSSRPEYDFASSRSKHVEIYHLFSAYAAVTRSVILPMAVLDELLRGAESSAEG
jgi:hypothetical protein